MNEMDQNTEVTAVCASCRIALPPTYTGPCPKCGQTGKNATVKLKSSVRVESSAKGSLTLERHRVFYKENPIIMWIIAILTVASSCIGLFLSGLVGAIIGFFLGILALYLGPHAFSKVEKIERDKS